MKLNVPHSWKDMHHYSRCQYLLNTKQATSFSDAAKKISAHSKAEIESRPKPVQTVRQIRLPYSDN